MKRWSCNENVVEHRTIRRPSWHSLISCRPDKIRSWLSATRTCSIVLMEERKRCIEFSLHRIGHIVPPVVATKAHGQDAFLRRTQRGGGIGTSVLHHSRHLC